MLNFFRKIFKKKESSHQEDEAQEARKPDIEVNTRVGERFFKLKDDDCGLVLHSDGNIDVLFTKSSPTNKSFSETEEALMALAVFVKQDGFLALIQDEFRKIASSVEKNGK